MQRWIFGPHRKAPFALKRSPELASGKRSKNKGTKRAIAALHRESPLTIKRWNAASRICGNSVTALNLKCINKTHTIFRYCTATGKIEKVLVIQQ
ncbi:hypothetical protein [Labrenzia sp. THAF82]|uniref:hypothetical protein n=1 Tax=Labrenzia sp. THAF82 TaxID=2587861 RepID=UPI0012693DAB|nr:hypothetical protein [Labrenzia sp. THAF82]